MRWEGVTSPSQLASIQRRNSNAQKVQRRSQSNPLPEYMLNVSSLGNVYLQHVSHRIETISMFNSAQRHCPVKIVYAEFHAQGVKASLGAIDQDRTW